MCYSLHFYICEVLTNQHVSEYTHTWFTGWVEGWEMPLLKSKPNSSLSNWQSWGSHHPVSTRYSGKHKVKSAQLYLVGIGTSASPVSSTAGDNRTNATTARSRNSSSPTKMFDASAPGGIFFMKCRSTWEKYNKLQPKSYSKGFFSLCFVDRDFLIYNLSYFSYAVPLFLSAE